MIKTLRNKKGVTLIELLAVVVILGIIAAIAVPTIGGLIERQERRAAEATWTTIEEQAKVYAEDEDPFTIQLLEDDDFVDLKSNVFSFDGTTPVLASAIWITVVGDVVTVYSDALGTTGTDLYINGHMVYED